MPSINGLEPMQITARPCGSLIRGVLPVGCRQCTEGAKMVLFVTGLCSFHCFYCPVSEEKMYTDVIFANERRVTSDTDVIEEARAMRASGAGITGGDPLDVVDRTCHYIRLLKQEFGPQFHTHLYTMTPDPEKIRKLGAAGLDEIRFHVPAGLWSRVATTPYPKASRLAKSLGITVGLEVPLLPDRASELAKLLEWAEAEDISFVNLNELEFSDANYARMVRHGYEPKAELAFGVKGADAAADELLRRSWRITVHYCTSGYKDGFQLRERMKRRAETLARPLDLITEDGTVVKGVIEGDDLDAIATTLRRRYHVPADLLAVVPERGRVEVAAWVLEGLSSRLGRPCHIVEEFPTADPIEVERTPLA